MTTTRSTQSYGSFRDFYSNVNVQLQSIAVDVGNRFRQITVYSIIQFSWFMEFFAGPAPIKASDESIADFKPRASTWLENFLNILGLQEQNMFSESKHVRMRQEISADPVLAGTTAVSGSSNNDVFFADRFAPASNKIVQRQRTWDFTPIASMIFIVANIWAGNSDIRPILNRYLSLGTPVPTIIQEKVLSARRSVCGNLFIIPGISGFLSDDILVALDLRNTIFDAKWLCSESGIDAMFGFFARLSKYEGNYIPMVQGRPVPIDSGMQTTEMSVTFETFSGAAEPPITANSVARRVYRTESGVPILGTPQIVPANPSDPQITPPTFARVAPGHSYGNQVNKVQVLDSYLFNRQLKNADNTQLIIGVFGPTGEISGTSFNFAAYVVSRSTGLIHNSPALWGVPNTSTEREQPAVAAEEKEATHERDSKPRSSRRSRGEQMSASSFVNVMAQLLRSGYITATQFTSLVSSPFRQTKRKHSHQRAWIGRYA